MTHAAPGVQTVAGGVGVPGQRAPEPGAWAVDGWNPPRYHPRMSNAPPSERGGSERQLWDLIEARSRPGADTEGLDRRIWSLFGETWAVMFTDLAGFSRQVAEFGIIHFLQVIHDSSKLLLPVIQEHDGLLVKTEGDSLLILFRRPEQAVACGIAMQRACARVNRGRQPEDQILLCLGIGHGEVLRIGDADVWGAEVNAASKLGEDVARREEILVTGAVRDVLERGDGVEGVEGFEELEEAIPGTDRGYRLRYRQGVSPSAAGPGPGDEG